MGETSGAGCMFGKSDSGSVWERPVVLDVYVFGIKATQDEECWAEKKKVILDAGVYLRDNTGWWHGKAVTFGCRCV